METLRPLGRGIWEVLEPTFKAYEPLLLAMESEIRSARRTTHQYGPHPRQMLDVYYPDNDAEKPPTTTSGSAKPVLAFFYGGGFVGGDRTSKTYANDLIFANLGHFFAKRFGFTVVVADYRLMRHGARFPSGGEDVCLAVEWIRGVLSQLEGYEGGIDLFLMGNSAGGVHVATWMLAPEFFESREAVMERRESRVSEGREQGRTLLRGILLLGTPCHYGDADDEILHEYFGRDQIFENCPMGLLRAAKQRPGCCDGWPDVGLALLVSEFDPEDLIVETNRDFEREWPCSDVEFITLEGHNHISPQTSLATGIEKEEAWGVEVARFCERYFT